MAMIQCSECGRAISDKSAMCIGCGAPIPEAKFENSIFNAAPKPEKTAPLTAKQLRRRALLASLTLIVGMVASGEVDRHGGNRIAATIAALVLIGGLCWLIVAMVQNVTARRKS
jgi:hypothetical protein